MGDHVVPAFRPTLVLTRQTRHRIGSIRLLRWSDVDLDARWVRRRAEHDQIGYEHVTPLTEDAGEAIRTARAEQQAIGEA